MTRSFGWPGPATAASPLESQAASTTTSGRPSASKSRPDDPGGCIEAHALILSTGRRSTSCAATWTRPSTSMSSWADLPEVHLGRYRRATGRPRAPDDGPIQRVLHARAGRALLGSPTVEEAVATRPTLSPTPVSSGGGERTVSPEVIEHQA